MTHHVLRFASPVLVAAAVGGVLWVSAGDLNPPPGAVTPTMRTLDEIYNLVQQGGTGGGSCGPCIHGDNRLLGTVLVREFGDDPFDLVAMKHNITQPIDPSTGQATGGRFHIPLIITKNIDRATPLINRAVCFGDVIAAVKINLFDPALGHYYTIELSEVKVVDVSTYMQTRCDGGYAHMEDVSFAYREIRWMIDTIDESAPWSPPQP